MDKSSAFVWNTARRQANGLPDCPVDLTEPEYANLVFCASCHNCGKYAPTVLWRMRRRYCLDCRIARLCSLSSCHEVIRSNKVLATEQITIEGETTMWADREQTESFMHEYKQSSNQAQLLNDRIEQHLAICMHARQCEKYQRDKASERKVDLKARRRDRENSIFERLRQLGYEREVAYCPNRIVQSCKALFGKSKPLTDKEWKRIWPEWLETMNSLRSQRLDKVVYARRRRSFASEYADYVTRPSPNTPTFDLLPHAADVACFPPFRNIIRAPEGTQMGDKPFESALAQLPELVGEWRKKLDAEVAELVKIPSHLSSKSTFDGRVVSPTSTTSSESSPAATDRLRLACALFSDGIRGSFTHPEVFFGSMCYSRYPRPDGLDSERTGSILDRYGIKYMTGAPYVIHACGLDPNVVTADDMDRRNARLQCLSCMDSRVRRWRDAVWHAHSYHQGWAVHFEPPRWEAVGDEHVTAIQAAELSFQRELPPDLSRCLICLPRVGDVIHHQDITFHLKDFHNIKAADVQQGVHYAPSGTRHKMFSLVFEHWGDSKTFRGFSDAGWLWGLAFLVA